MILVIDFAQLHHGPATRDSRGEPEVLFDNQNGGAGICTLVLQGSRDAMDDRGLKAIRNLVDQQ